jgi:predicted lipoprotein with Yx(FWY)xxD motif
MRSKLLIGAAALMAAAMLPLATATAASGGTNPDPNQATVMLANSPYGRILVVGGAGAGYVPATSTTPAHYVYPTGSSLYLATIDRPSYKTEADGSYFAGCRTKIVPTAFGNISCTGAETDVHADWPALTTDVAPISGTGILPGMLGTVWRNDLGTYQVTFRGHPLYLFAPGAGDYSGANFYETVLPLPPWHTAWYLVSQFGLPATGPATIETQAPQPGTTYDTTKIAVEMLPNKVPGGAAVSAYSYSSDPLGHRTCLAGCARLMIPVYTVGAPVIGPGVNASAVGTISLPSGIDQVTYNGKPLYIYNQEQPLVGSHGLVTTGTAGNGDGVMWDSGTFSLVNP